MNERNTVIFKIIQCEMSYHSDYQHHIHPSQLFFTSLVCVRTNTGWEMIAEEFCQFSSNGSHLHRVGKHFFSVLMMM